MKSSELLRLATYYAIQDRELWLKTFENCTDANSLAEIAEAKKFINELKRYRYKRWNKAKLAGKFRQEIARVPAANEPALVVSAKTVLTGSGTLDTITLSQVHCSACNKYFIVCLTGKTEMSCEHCGEKYAKVGDEWQNAKCLTVSQNNVQ